MARYRLLIALALAMVAAPVAAQDLPASLAAIPPTVPTEGSLGPGVYLEDITYTIRLAFVRTLTVSRTNPDVAFAGSYDGFVWKTVDGGRTWDESRLIVETKPFWGDAYERVYFGVHRLDSGPSRAFDDKTARRSGRTGNREGAASGGGNENQSSGGGRGAEANVNFGIGVPGGAPRLQLLVRKLGKPTSGINMKQLLLLRGSRPLEVRIIIIHPHNPKVVFACTMFGLYKTDDGGLNWVRTFAGTSPKGWNTFHLAVDPSDDKRVLLATGEGLYISNDGGDNFSRSTKKGVGEGTIDWIYYSPYDPRYVFVGTDYGMLRSSDGGENWDWTYFTTFPDGRVVRSIEIDPFDKKTGYIATHDGLYYTDNILTGGLEDWKRMGGLKFTGMETSKIAVCPRHRGHMWTLTNMMVFTPTSPGKSETGGAFVYETLDGGKTWNVIFAGNTTGSMQWFDTDPRDPDMLWLVWSRSMSRLRRQTPGATQPPRQIIPDDPPIGDVLQAAFRYLGAEPGLLLDYRRRSRIKALVPRVDAQLLHYRWNDYLALRDGLYPTLPYLRDEGWGTPQTELRLMLTWDLAPLIFTLDASMFGRIERLTYELREFVKFEVHRFYGELRRLRALMAIRPPKDRRISLMYKLRMEELAAHMDFVTGGYLTRWWKGKGHPSGADTRWWERWKPHP